MRTLRASEIGTYLYCARAWWYQKKGVPSSRLPDMALGTEYHQVHGRRVAATVVVQNIAVFLFIIGIVCLVYFFTQYFM